MRLTLRLVETPWQPNNEGQPGTFLWFSSHLPISGDHMVNKFQAQSHNKHVVNRKCILVKFSSYVPQVLAADANCSSISMHFCLIQSKALPSTGTRTDSGEIFFYEARLINSAAG